VCFKLSNILEEVQGTTLHYKGSRKKKQEEKEEEKEKEEKEKEEKEKEEKEKEEKEKEEKECDWSYQLMEFYSVEINFYEYQAIGLIEFAINETYRRAHTYVRCDLVR
jgi:ABC-type Zn2+ transport system substrate-binding protein/surface adhesin